MDETNIENFHGFAARECGEHRTTGARAWCHDCLEWCYQDVPCKGCELPQIRDALDAARAEVATLTVEVERLRAELAAAESTIAVLEDPELRTALTSPTTGDYGPVPYPTPAENHGRGRERAV